MAANWGCFFTALISPSRINPRRRASLAASWHSSRATGVLWTTSHRARATRQILIPRSSVISAGASMSRPGAAMAKIPAFSLPGSDGETYSAKGLKGRAYVLYFYPKDDTPGCTQEACDFRDQIAIGDILQ